MEFNILKEIILKRRSIRKFKVQEIDEESLIDILEISTWAPSAGNLQSWDMVLIKDQPIKKALAVAALGQNFIAEASHVIIVCANLPRTARIYGQRGATLYAYQDTAAFIQNLLLLIHSKGWGAVWIGAFKESEVADIIKVEEGIRPIAIIPVGIPDQEPASPRRIPLSKILHINSFGNLFKKKV
ncbi:MAG: nitroreductase family protein [Candidatus Lokiarchaeota archaeon]|nr:nitroreductase family protein [Candidatus Lokiarchaeota archaeon]